ncbi:hypothetical protein D3C73_885000 [compost metagenome]
MCKGRKDPGQNQQRIGRRNHRYSVPEDENAHQDHEQFFLGQAVGEDRQHRRTNGNTEGIACNELSGLRNTHP